MATPKKHQLVYFKRNVVQAYNCWFDDDFSRLQEGSVYGGTARISDGQQTIDFECEVYRERGRDGFDGVAIPGFLVVAVFATGIDKEMDIVSVEVPDPAHEVERSTMQKILQDHLQGAS